MHYRRGTIRGITRGGERRKKKKGSRAESEIRGLVTFNLVALHIAILHFTYDGDIQDNNNRNNQGRQVNKLLAQRQCTQ